MKIVVATHYFSTHGGGIERVCEHLTSLVSQQPAWCVEWHASDCDPPPKPTERRNAVAARSTNFIERTTGLPYPLWSFPSYVRLWRAVERCDLVHVHDYLYPSSLVALLAARCYRKPCVLTQHVGHIPYRSAFKRSLLSLLNRTLGRFCLASASRVVFVSESVLSYFGRFVELKNAKLIQNGVDQSTFTPITDAKRQHLRLKLLLPQAFIVAFVGRFTEKKGLQILYDVARDSPNVTFVFVGTGEFDPSLWGRANVRVLKNLAAHQVAEVYQAADLLMLPSSGEGFPLVVQESMACGTPAAVSEEVANALPGLVPLVYSLSVSTSSASHNWSGLLARLTANPETQIKRAEVAAFAHNAWSWQKCANAYMELFNDIAKRNAA